MVDAKLADDDGFAHSTRGEHARSSPEHPEPPEPLISDLLRGTILDNAIALGREKGAVEAITMRSLAQRTGLSPTALYSHFACKHNLLAAARHRALSDLRGRLHATLTTNDARALTAWVLCYASGEHLDPWLFDLFPTRRAMRDPADPTHQEEVTKIIGLASLQHVLDSVHERGELAPGVSPLLGSWLLWSGAHSLLTLCTALGQEHELDDETTLQHLVEAVVHGVVPQRRPRHRG